MKRLHIALIGLLIPLVGASFTYTTASAKKHQVSKITKIRVTSKHVYGHTTKYAKINLLSTHKKSLGHSTANKKGNFTIKTKKNLKKITFKIKVTKKGYVSRTTKYSLKMTKAQKLTSSKNVSRNNNASTGSSSKTNTTLSSTKNIKTNDAALSAAKLAVSSAQSNWNSAQRKWNSISVDLSVAKATIASDEYKLSLHMEDPSNPHYASDVELVNSEIAKFKNALPELQEQSQQAEQDFNVADSKLKKAQAALSQLE